MIVSDNPDRRKTSNSKAASTQYEVVKEKKYDMGGSSTGELIHKCGIHDYETKSMKEFNEHIALHNDNGTGSKAGSSVLVKENKIKEIYEFINGKH
jgi:hypothetical protein